MSNPKIRIGFRGFGRIGAHVLRALYDSPMRETFEISLIQVSSLRKKTIEDRANDLLYDPQYGKWEGRSVSFSETGIVIDGFHIPMRAAKEDGEAPWREYELDVLIECTNDKKSQELRACAAESEIKKVIIAHPAEDADRTLIVGVNHAEYDSADRILSCGSCTTNCLAPILYVLQKEALSLIPCFAHTVHAATSSQDVLETLGQIGNHTTGAAQLIGKLFPDFEGRMIVSADRVPTPEVSKLIIGFLSVDEGISTAFLKDMFTRASNTYLSGILDVISLKRHDLSGRHRKNPHSAVLNAESIQEVWVGNQRLTTLYAWYDNEYAYSCRVRDLLFYIAEREGWIDRHFNTMVDDESVPRPEDQLEKLL